MTYTGAHLDGDVVVITGGGTGIGAAIAERLASENAKVVILGRRNAPLEEVAERTGATPLVADASDPDSMAVARDRILDMFGGVDAFVANAGGGGFSALGETTDAEWADSLQANLSTAFVSCRAFLPSIIEQRGSIVVVSSLSGLAAGPSMAGYTTAKHALIGLTRSLARDYGGRGIRVNAVSPGWVRTPMADEEMDEIADHLGLATRQDAYELATRDVPLRRAADPSDVAAAVRFLVSRESAYITGSTVVVDGGAHIVDVPTLALQEARL